MMPSRGAFLTQGRAPRLFQLQSRNLSSAPPRIPSNRFQRLTSTPRPSILSSNLKTTPLAIPSIGAIRHASTTPQAPATSAPPTTAPADATAASAAATPTPAASESAFPNLDTIVLDDLTPSASTIPEHIGYLHSIGLDYGYGPTTCIQWLLEHYHIYGHLPWWASIAATAFTLRVLMFPLFLKSSDTTARATAMTSVTKPLTDRMSQCQKEGNAEGMRDAYMQLSAVRRNAGIRIRDQLAPMFVQGVVGYCGFKLTHACAALPVPGFETGGFLHLQDLTIPDPFLIVPVLMGVTMHFIVRMGGESGAIMQNAQTAQMQKLMLYIMPVGITIFTGWQPGAVAVWFASSGSVGLVQARMLQNEGVRQWLGIAPLYKPTAAEGRDMGAFGVLAERFNPAAGRDSGNVIDVKGRSVAGSSSSSSSSSSRMKPTYQAPNLRNQSTRAGSGVHPAGGFEQEKTAPPQEKQSWNPITKVQGFLAQVKRMQANKMAQKAQDDARKAQIDRARNYEQRAKRRPGR